ncbi:hypothetical protein YC2023_000074 [Brassica napus]
MEEEEDAVCTKTLARVNTPLSKAVPDIFQFTNEINLWCQTKFGSQAIDLMEKQLKEKITKKEKEREEKDQSLSVEASFTTTGRNSSKIFPSRSSYNQQASSNRKSKT